MNNPNEFENQPDQPQTDADNQPALQIPHVDHQRDDGSGLTSGTAPGINSTDPYQFHGPQSIGSGSDPHSGTGDGTGVATGQYRGSDDGTTIESPDTTSTSNNQSTGSNQQ